MLERIDLDTLRAQGYVFNIELTYRALLAGFRVREIPIRFQDRREGRSKISFSVAVETLKLVPRLRHDRATWAVVRAPDEETAASSR